MSSGSATKIVIVGAGPSGLLLAYKLLSSKASKGKFDIILLEQRTDFREYSPEQSRTFPIALQSRGWNALPSNIQSILSSQGVWADGVCMHNSRTGKARVIVREQSNLSIDRNRVALTLLEELVRLQETVKSPHTLSLQFETTVESVDFSVQSVNTKRNDSDVTATVSYDYLVAADGGKSKIRQNLVDCGDLLCEAKEIPNDYRTLHLLREAPPVAEKPPQEPSSLMGKLIRFFFPPKPSLLPPLVLDSNKIHAWMFANSEEKCIGAPIHPGLVSCAFVFNKGQDPFKEMTGAYEVQEYFQSLSPKGLGRLLTDQEAEALLQRRTGSLQSVRCNQLHAGKVLLLGDAGHAVSASAGQGANSALQDVQVFCKLLEDLKNDWDAALPKYTQVRLSDAHAVSDISDYSSPVTKWQRLEFVFRMVGRMILPKCMLRPMPMELLNDTTKSYTEILEATQWWIDKVRRAHQAQGY